jgi:hypothetical protein
MVEGTAEKLGASREIRPGVTFSIENCKGSESGVNKYACYVQSVHLKYERFEVEMFTECTSVYELLV